jgi:hypothetical protein
MNAPPDPEQVVRSIAEAGKGVRLGPGVVGKTTYATIALVTLWTIIAFRIGTSAVLNGFLLSVGVMATGAYVFWVLATQRFAERNPAQAMLEGAQFLEFKRFEAESKAGGREHGEIGSGTASDLLEGPK